MSEIFLVETNFLYFRLRWQLRSFKYRLKMISCVRHKWVGKKQENSVRLIYLYIWSILIIIKNWDIYWSHNLSVIFLLYSLFHNTVKIISHFSFTLLEYSVRIIVWDVLQIHHPYLFLFLKMRERKWWFFRPLSLSYLEKIFNLYRVCPLCRWAS